MVDASQEADDWVPEDAAEYLAQFTRQHLTHLPSAAIRELVSSLNSMWRRRSSKQVAAGKEKAAAHLGELKRSLGQRASYREVVQQTEISRLTRELSEARRKVRGRSKPRSASHSRREVRV